MSNNVYKTPSMNTRRAKQVQQQQQQQPSVVKPPFKPIAKTNQNATFSKMVYGALAPTADFSKVSVRFSPNPTGAPVMYGNLVQGTQEVRFLLTDAKTKGFSMFPITGKDGKMIFNKYQLTLGIDDGAYAGLYNLIDRLNKRIIKHLPSHLGNGQMEFKPFDNPLFTSDQGYSFIRTVPGKEIKGADGYHYFNELYFFQFSQQDRVTVSLEEMDSYFTPGSRSTLDILLRPYVKINTDTGYFQFVFAIKAIENKYTSIPPALNADSFVINMQSSDDDEEFADMMEMTPSS